MKLFLIIAVVFWVVAGAGLLIITIRKLSHVVEEIDSRIDPIQCDLNNLKETKANRKVYVKVGDAWIIRKKHGNVCAWIEPYFYTVGAKHDRFEFVGNDVYEAFNLAKQYNGKLIDVAKDKEKTK